ncbi:hypothetical protein ATCC90586_011221 [Pythium insidiosum]|nr:hypothetical protein ATCC90586_011221 [Pythium insidiosum]
MRSRTGKRERRSTKARGRGAATAAPAADSQAQERLRKHAAACLRRVVLDKPHWWTLLDDDAQVATWTQEIVTEALATVAEDALAHIEEQLRATGEEAVGLHELRAQLPAHLLWLQAPSTGGQSDAPLSRSPSPLYSGVPFDRYHVLVWFIILERLFIETSCALHAPS